MEATGKFIRNTTLLLCFTAGFCDTLTFVAAGEVFSAHVTGNFIVFAYDLIKHPDGYGWQKLLTFPVFILAVMLGGAIANRSANKYTLLILESLLLLLGGALSAVFLSKGEDGGWMIQVIVLIIVTAMAFQNTFGKINSKATFGLTTVMTGNVTQAALDLLKIVAERPLNADVSTSFKKQLHLVFGFLAGCLAGALMAMQFGLASALLPGTLMLLWLWVSKLLSGATQPV